MQLYNNLSVYFNEILVGKLAITPQKLVAFEYDTEWIANGFSISPLSLPLEKKVFIPKYDPFDGLFGVFNDTLPDGWGRLLIDRVLLKNKIDPGSINPLNRLSIVGDSGMGALIYKPENPLAKHDWTFDLDKLAAESKKILDSEFSNNLEELAAAGGSSGGARPKILTKIDGEDWLIKFFSSQDPKNTGRIEHLYSEIAKHCGIEMPETRLFESSKCSGYFGVRRFDRINEERVHMVSVSGLLETSHRIPNLDYKILMKLTLQLTNNFAEIEKLYRLMCFNVFSHNRDDHSKNFSFLYNSKTKEWQLSPAYDLTFSHSINGEHATTINGEGKNPSKEDLLAVAKDIGLSLRTAKNIILEVEERTRPLQGLIKKFKSGYATP